MSGLRSVHLLLSAMALPALVLASATACEPAPTPPHNDNFAGATVLPAAAQGLVQGTAAGATRQSGEPASGSPQTVWFRWTAPQSGAAEFTALNGLGTQVAAYTGTALGQLHAASSDDVESAAFRTSAGTAYSIRVTSYAGAAFMLKWAMNNAPVNDTRVGAITIPGDTGSIVDDATAATADASDPLIAGFQTPATVWYRWTAPADGWYEFDTHGSQVSTVLGVYTDTTPAQLVDDSAGECPGSDFFGLLTASVKFHATSGSSYLVMLGGTNADDPTSASLGGPVQLNWRAVANAPLAAGNDAFANPTTISGTYGAINGNTDGATVEPGEPAIAGQPPRNSVWFSWSPPVTGVYVLSTLPGSTDGCSATLAVYTGNSLATLKPVANLNAGSLPAGAGGSPGDASGGIAIDSSSEAVAHLIAGTAYRIAADGLEQAGPFTLSWDMPPEAPVIRSATPGNGSIGVIWSPPPATAGSARSGYFVVAIPVNDQLDSSEPQALPVTAAFTTIHALQNGVAYQVLVAAINGSGPGDPAISRPVTPVSGH